MTPEKGHRRLLALCDQREFPAAIRLAQRLVRDHPAQPVFWHLLGCAASETGDLPQSEWAFTRLIALQDDNAVAHFNLGCVLQQQDKTAHAITHFTRSLAIDPSNPQAQNNLGTALRKLGRLPEAAQALRQAVSLDPAYLDAQFNLAGTLRGLGDLDTAMQVCRHIADHRPHDAANRALLLQMQGQICDFAAFHDFEALAPTLGITSRVPPHAMLHLEDHPERQLLRARKWSADSFGAIQAAPPTHPPHEKPRIGYFSTNFHEHPNLFLVAGLLRSHDRSRFDIHAFDLAPPHPSAMKDQLKSDVPHYHTVHALSAKDIAEFARDHAVDVAIDLDGHIRNARTDVLAHRAAPLQISFLGFPGSSGAPFFDYLVADPTVIPPDQRTHYDERILFMPHTYQPTDNRRKMAQNRPTRAELGLPPDAFVFCCFNAGNKIGPAEFDIWMRVMAQVPHGILWLLEANPMMRGNLGDAAKARGVSPDRLHFAPRLPQAEHLARLGQADLFVDTFNYNAHTTASDALWAGVPVLTKPGQQFAARVAASLLKAIDMPDLIADTARDYEARMLALATSPDDMTRLKSRLARNRLSSALFDTERYTRDFEDGLTAILARHAQGLPPEDIHLG